MSLRLLPRLDWEARLKAQRCSLFLDGGRPVRFPTGEIWETEHKKVFPVPVDDNGYVREDDFQQVIVRIAQLRPIE